MMILPRLSQLHIVLTCSLTSILHIMFSGVCSETSMAPNVMAAELQLLEALKEESFVHCNVIRQVEDLGQKHAKGYDALRQKQHRSLKKVRLASLLIDIFGSSDSIM